MKFVPNGTGKFRFWCQKVLPLVYDDSLSYYEVLCKLTKFVNDLAERISDAFDEINTNVREYVYQWLDDHPEATTTVEDGSITEPKLAESLADRINTENVKNMWSIQTDTEGDGTFYQLAVSSDGYGHTLVDGFRNFLATPANLGTDWLHFQHEDYHVFTITYTTSTYDFYIAITNDFVNWVHKPITIGFKANSAYSGAYVWTPQIFEFDNKLYLSATVQEDAPVENGDLYGRSVLRKSAIYVCEITLDYESGTITRVGNFTRIAFGDITDRSGVSHNVSGNAMDAWFVPFNNELYCVFNERLMQEIHVAKASSINSLFTIVAQNIFKTPYIEAPTVLQVTDNVWKISACSYGRITSRDEENICCYTSDFETFEDYGFMKRIDKTDGEVYHRRMRNPSFFYMTDEQEKNICVSHKIRTNNYIHIFKPGYQNLRQTLANVFNLTEVAVPPNYSYDIAQEDGVTMNAPLLSNIYGGDTELIIKNRNTANRDITYNNSTYKMSANSALHIDRYSGVASLTSPRIENGSANLITLATSFEGADIASCTGRKTNQVVNLRLILGSLTLASGSNTIGTVDPKYRPQGSDVVFAGFVGSGSTMGTTIRGSIAANGQLKLFAPSAMSGTFRADCTYIGY